MLIGILYQQEWWLLVYKSPLRMTQHLVSDLFQPSKRLLLQIARVSDWLVYFTNGVQIIQADTRRVMKLGVTILMVLA